MSTRAIAVIGSGSAGLAAGFRLREAGFAVRMFESGDRVGGRMRSEHRGGFVIDEGATWVAENYKSMLSLIDDAGLRDQLEPSATSFAFPRDGVLHVMDGGHLLRTGLHFSLLSLKSKLRLAGLVRDCLRYRRRLASGDLSILADIDDESAADYALRRLGRETLDYVVNPSMGCMAGDTPERISKVDLLYGFSTFLFGLRAYMFRGGMGAYAEQISKGFDVELNARVSEVIENEDGVTVTWVDSAGVARPEVFAGCVLAVPPEQVVKIHTEMDGARREFLGSTPSVPCVVVSVGMRSVPDHTTAAYIAVPDVVEPGIMVIGLPHNQRPDLVPSGKSAAVIYAAPELSAELLSEPDERCVERVLAAVDRVVPGLVRDVEFSYVRKWTPMLLTSRPGYYRALARFNELSQRNDRRIRMAGDYYSVSSMNVACASGQRAARDLAGFLQAPIGSAGPS